MAQSPDTMGTKFYSLLMFLLVSVLSGVLLAGLFVPAAALTGAAAKASSVALESLPVELETPPQAETSRVLMSDGSLLANIYKDDRTYVQLAKIAPVMQKAQLAIEDKRFYTHGALDFEGFMRALVVSGGQQGGSTITQQYVKQVQIENARAKADDDGVRKAQEHTITRKIQELRYAVAMEHKFSKDVILERYLNIAYYGDGSYGVESAARHYFAKNASSLNLAESAMLAGIVKNPSALNPAFHPKAAIDRRNTVLNVMLTQGVISKAEHDKAVKVGFDPKKVSVRKRGCANAKFPHICSYALKELQQLPAFGDNPKERLENIERGGFTIQLTIDPKDQQMAQDEIMKRVGPTDPVIGLMNVVDPATGQIVVMAQSRPQVGTAPGQTFYNYNASPAMGGAEGYQPGSNFKVFTLAAAVAQGVPPSRRYDSPSPMSFKGTTFKACDGTFRYESQWTPKNDGGRAGNFDMIFAAQHSVNTWFIQLERDVGICASIKMAEAAGVAITTGKLRDFQYTPSFVLGVAEVVPVTMAAAYGTLANRGTRCAPTLVKGIKTKAGKEIKWPYPKCARAMEEKVADGTNKVLQAVMHGGGSGAPMYIPGYQLAGKTGTTDSAQSLWFSGYSPNLAGSSAIVIDKRHPYWKDLNHRKNISAIRASDMSTGVKFGGYGMDAGKFWKPIMKTLLDKRPKAKFTDPPREVTEGKMVDIPDLTGNPDQDEKLLTDAGFLVQRANIASSRPRGSYLGASRRGGKAPLGTTIKLYFSTGVAKPKPTAKPKPKPKPDPKPNPEAPTTTAPPKPAPKPTTAPPTPVPKPTVAPPPPKPVPTTQAPKPPAPKPTVSKPPATKATVPPKPAPKPTQTP